MPAQFAELSRWRAAWAQLGASSTDDELYRTIVAGYVEPHRKYHTMQHLGECFAHLAALRGEAERPFEIEVALWFHDAIYEVRRKDNEERCADWARQSALAAGVPPDCAVRLHRLVMVTRHDGIADTQDARVMVDVDLAILGAEPARFDEYERQVRAEYRWVPGFLYRRERAKVLRAFAARENIYSTAPFRASREAPARENIARSLARL